MRLLLLALVLHAPVFAAEETKSSVPSAAVLNCKSGEDVRLIKMELKEGGGCEVVYVKNGADHSVASAQHETERCASTVTKIKATLEGAGFQCN